MAFLILIRTFCVLEGRLIDHGMKGTKDPTCIYAMDCGF